MENGPHHLQFAMSAQPQQESDKYPRSELSWLVFLSPVCKSTETKRAIMPYTWGKSASMEALPEGLGFSQEGPPSFDIERPLRPPPPEAPRIAQGFQCSPEADLCLADLDQLECWPGSSRLKHSRLFAESTHGEGLSSVRTAESASDQPGSKRQSDERKALPASQCWQESVGGSTVLIVE
jgi:hypothetical protein